MTTRKWRKSTRSNAQGACVEVAETSEEILVRDSKDPDGPVLAFSPQAWSAFIASAKDGKLEASPPSGIC